MFLYVMTKEAKDLLEKHGFLPIKYDARNSVWCFDYSTMHFDDFALDFPHVISDTLVF